MTSIRFDEVSIRGVRCWKEGGNSRQETRKFFQTMNPWNRDERGNLKTRAQIMTELVAERDAWLKLTPAWGFVRLPAFDFGKLVASQALLAELQEEVKHRQKDWTKLLFEISKLDEEWVDSDESNMDEFDPWDALRKLQALYRSRLALLAEMREALENYLSDDSKVHYDQAKAILAKPHDAVPFPAQPQAGFQITPKSNP
jgi:hypothetical protein